jgi:hypothetical protein
MMVKIVLYILTLATSAYIHKKFVSQKNNINKDNVKDKNENEDLYICQTNASEEINDDDR